MQYNICGGHNVNLQNPPDAFRRGRVVRKMMAADRRCRDGLQQPLLSNQQIILATGQHDGRSFPDPFHAHGDGLDHTDAYNSVRRFEGQINHAFRHCYGAPFEKGGGCCTIAEKHGIAITTLL